MTRLAVLAALLAAALPPPSPPDEKPRPVDVFAKLDGEWKGAFVGYDEEGRELYRIQVVQRYRTVDEHTQRVEIEDRMPDGRVVRGTGFNEARVGEDGELQLRCVVEKDDGDRVEHKGRLVRGPGGEEEIVWYTRLPDRVETFREAVTGEGDAAVYRIDGMGRYGERMILMAGRYARP